MATVSFSVRKGLRIPQPTSGAAEPPLPALPAASRWEYCPRSTEASAVSRALAITLQKSKASARASLELASGSALAWSPVPKEQLLPGRTLPLGPLALLGHALAFLVEQAQHARAAHEEWQNVGLGRRDLCFARITERRAYAPPPSVKKVEYYSVHKVRPDGRCMFRALVQGMATNKGMSLSDDEETAEADELRLAVADALCHSEKRRAVYEEALIAITIEESLKRYCQRILRSDFWGGESELLVLSRMCSQPIVVYIPESKARRDGARWGSGYVPIAEYGSEFLKASKTRKARRSVRLLYNGVNHYDLLL